MAFYFKATFRFCLGAFLGNVISRMPSDRSALTSSTFISSGSDMLRKNVLHARSLHMYSWPFLSYFQPAVPVIDTESSFTSISISSFLKPGISAFRTKSLSLSSKSTVGTLVSGIMGKMLLMFVGNRRSSKSLLNLAKVLSKACQRSEVLAGALLFVFF